jgi:hypothetical protein
VTDRIIVRASFSNDLHCSLGQLYGDQLGVSRKLDEAV